MRLKEWDDQAQTEIQREYPDEPGTALLNWMRNTKRWREDPQRLFDRYLHFERQLTDIRNADALERAQAQQAQEAAADGPCIATTLAGDPCKGRAVRDGLCMAHLKVRAAA